MKKILIVANWKMNPIDSSDAAKLFGRVANEISSSKKAEVVLCPPFPFIFQLTAHEPDIRIGAQNCFWEQEGAFTGEVSPAMLKALGCSHVILGHSEREQHLGETNKMVNRKLKAVLQAGLTPVVCIGEHVEEEIKEVLEGIDDTSSIVLVYEPEWAISTSENARPSTPENCKEAIEKIRSILNVPVLYGGSVDSTNITQFIKEGGVQGALVGSASLKPEEFIALVKNAVSG